jgi:hypothetical protein
VITFRIQTSVYVMMHGGEVAHEGRGYCRACCCPQVPTV